MGVKSSTLYDGVLMEGYLEGHEILESVLLLIVTPQLTIGLFTDS